MSTTILAADGSVVEAPVDWANLTRGGAAQMFVNIELHQRLEEVEPVGFPQVTREGMCDGAFLGTGMLLQWWRRPPGLSMTMCSCFVDASIAFAITRLEASKSELVCPVQNAKCVL